MSINRGINVLSLFDGISVAQLALNQLNIPIYNYFASEIDKNCIKLTQHHFPETIQLGDIRNIDAQTLPKIDLVMCGSSCQDLSVMNKSRLGLDGNKSSLFYDAVRILNVIRKKNPDCIFIFENVQMPSKDKQIFKELLGVEPIRINSALVSPALRNRLYFANIPNISIPKNKNIQLQDIVENGYVDRDKATAILTKNIPYTKKGLKRYLTKSIGQVVFHSEEFAKLSKKEKLERIESMSDAEVKALFRPFYVSELEKCQTLPVGYVGNILKKTPSQHAVGNGFTVEVIKHILSHADFGRG